jgi:hypothetical protein
MAIWVIYGSIVDVGPIVWANVLTFVQAVSILVIKLRGQPKIAR